jgi:hypothetical protein
MRYLVAVLFVLGCKGDPDKCDTGCRNYAQLVFWDNAEKEIAAAPAAERDALRKKKMGEFSHNVSRGIDMCTSQCMSANNSKTIDCLIAAKTAKEARACASD